MPRSSACQKQVADSKEMTVTGRSGRYALKLYEAAAKSNAVAAVEKDLDLVCTCSGKGDTQCACLICCIVPLYACVSHPTALQGPA